MITTNHAQYQFYLVHDKQLMLFHLSALNRTVGTLYATRTSVNSFSDSLCILTA